MKNYLILMFAIASFCETLWADEAFFIESCDKVFEAIILNNDSKVSHLYPTPIVGVFSPEKAKGSLEKKHHKMMNERKGFEVKYKKIKMISSVSKRFEALGVTKLAIIKYLGKDGKGTMYYPSCKFGLIDEEWKLVQTPF